VDVLVMQMLHQQIHVAQLAGLAPIPPAETDLLALVSEPAVVVFAWSGENRGRHVGGARNGAVGVGREVFVGDRWGQRVQVAVGAHGVRVVVSAVAAVAVAVAVETGLLTLGRAGGGGFCGRGRGAGHVGAVVVVFLLLELVVAVLGQRRTW
jgi:hypothetical protein